MNFREFEFNRELVPGFSAVVRWPRVNVWPYLHLQLWRWSLTFRSQHVEAVVSDGVLGETKTASSGTKACLQQLAAVPVKRKKKRTTLRVTASPFDV